ncbi:MAG: spore germination protein [Limnochordaceae bacterium]|nr:spore germination protein [Limnochordaceae bacterium]
MLEQTEGYLGRPEDLIKRTLVIGNQTIVVVFIDGLVDRSSIQDMIVSHLQSASRRLRQTGKPPTPVTLSDTKNLLVGSDRLKQAGDPHVLTLALLDGATVIVSDQWEQALIASTEGWEKRDISEPETETVLRGPREGFTENLRTNTALVRRRLRTPDLMLERIRVGTSTNTSITLAWLRDVARPELVEEVKQRLRRVEMDAVLESGYLEEWIVDDPFSPFPQVMHTERPDRVTASLLEGRVAILTDGTPMALIVPATLNMLMQAADDYYGNWVLSLPTRLVRYTGMALTLLLPALYVALTAYQSELIPTPLMLAIAQQREAVPYPAIVEALMMSVVFQILIEAGVRLPRPVGSAVTIVGAIVIGQAAVAAGLVSATMVIFASLTALGSFVIPAYNLSNAIRWLGLGMLLLASLFGLTGILLGLLGIIIHLTGLRSFGEPYLLPNAPMVWSEQRDTFWRAPWWMQVRRPLQLGVRDVRRVGRAGGVGDSFKAVPQQPPVDPTARLELEQVIASAPAGSGRPNDNDTVKQQES